MRLHQDRRTSTDSSVSQGYGLQHLGGAADLTPGRDVFGTSSLDLCLRCVCVKHHVRRAPDEPS